MVPSNMVMLRYLVLVMLLVCAIAVTEDHEPREGLKELRLEVGSSLYARFRGAWDRWAAGETDKVSEPVRMRVQEPDAKVDSSLAVQRDPRVHGKTLSRAEEKLRSFIGLVGLDRAKAMIAEMDE